jgi:hypothetical protein
VGVKENDCSYHIHPNDNAYINISLVRENLMLITEDLALAITQKESSSIETFAKELEMLSDKIGAKLLHKKVLQIRRHVSLGDLDGVYYQLDELMNCYITTKRCLDSLVTKLKPKMLIQRSTLCL